jgi:hypothetical protein
MKLAAILILALLIGSETTPLGLGGGAHSSLAFGQALTSSHDVDRILDGYLTAIGGADAMKIRMRSKPLQ